MSDLAAAVSALYATHGKHHVLPFIGEAFEGAPGSTELRVLVVGLNSYISDLETNTDVDARSWASWFEQAGVSDDSFRFHRTAYQEAATLAAGLAHSPTFAPLRFEPEPADKRCFYATNLVKVYTSDEHKTDAKLTPAYLAPFVATWHRELDVLAKRGVFPHLIVAFGSKLWDPLWQSLCPDETATFPRYGHLGVVHYAHAPDEASPVFHHANRVRIRTPHGEQETLLVRLDHPSMPSKRTRTAAWLLAEEDFRDLAGLGVEYPPPDLVACYPDGGELRFRGNTFVRRGSKLNLVLPPDEGQGIGTPPRPGP